MRALDRPELAGSVMFILFAFGGLGNASPILKATGARDEPTAALVLVLVAETQGLLATGILVAAEYFEFGQNLFFGAVVGKGGAVGVQLFLALGTGERSIVGQVRLDAKSAE